MKQLRFLLVVSLAIVGAGVSGTANAGGGHYRSHGHHYGHHHGHVRGHVGIHFGPAAGWSWSPYYPYYPYYPGSSYHYQPYPGVVVVPSAPNVYIEQGQADYGRTAQPAPNDWYYCRKPEGYYPHVRRCPDGWQRVPAQPQE